MNPSRLAWSVGSSERLGHHATCQLLSLQQFGIAFDRAPGPYVSRRTTCSALPKPLPPTDGLQAIIAGAGGHPLPGMDCRHDHRAVLGVPVASRHLQRCAFRHIPSCQMPGACR